MKSGERSFFEGCDIDGFIKPKRAEEILHNLKTDWDITKFYWYPLTDTKRNDVIAFDAEYVERKDILEMIKVI